MGTVSTPRSVRIRAGQALIDGDLVVPGRPAGPVVFAHGIGTPLTKAIGWPMPAASSMTTAAAFSASAPTCSSRHR